MANCLLVGGGGFFGGHLTKRLLTLGHKVIVLDYKPYEASVQYAMRICHTDQRRFAYSQIDVTDPLVWVEAENMFSEADVVYMLVGLLGSVPCTQDMTMAVQRNVLPMALLIDSLVRIDARPLIVYPSSDLVYGKTWTEAATTMVTERPLCGYAVTKFASERLLATAELAFGIESLVFRVSTTYGPYQQRNSLVNFYVARALCGQSLTVYGDGRAMRDWLYIDDAVSALLLPLYTDVVRVLNVPGDQRRIWDVAETVVSVLGEGHVESVPWPELTERVDVGWHVLAGDGIRQLGWDVTIGLEEGIERTAEWMKGQQCTK